MLNCNKSQTMIELTTENRKIEHDILSNKSQGAISRWSHRAISRWSRGAFTRWSHGALSKWSHGAISRLSDSWTGYL